jgi:hypothetical protein
MRHHSWVNSFAFVVGVVGVAGVNACSGHGFDSMKRGDGGDNGEVKESGSPSPIEAGAGPRDSSLDSDTTPPSHRRDAQVAPRATEGGAEDGAAPPVSDASTDAGIRDGSGVVVPDSGPVGWCESTKATFCADFDRGVVTEGWTSSDVSSGATLEFNRQAYTSSPQSLRSKVPAGTGANSVASVVKKSLVSTLGRSVLEFDCNVSSIGTTSGEWILQIARLERNGTDEAVGIFARSTGNWSVIFGIGAVPVLFDLPAPPKYGRFVRISLDVVWSPTAGSAHLAFDGVQVLAKDGITTAQKPATKTIDLVIGLVDADGSTPPSVVSFDNVTLQQH